MYILCISRRRQRAQSNVSWSNKSMIINLPADEFELAGLTTFDDRSPKLVPAPESVKSKELYEVIQTNTPFGISHLQKNTFVSCYQKCACINTKATALNYLPIYIQSCPTISP